MSVGVLFQCNGCDVSAGPTVVPSEFRSLSGRDHGYGRQVQPPVATLAPEGWMPFDPYTGCCYCPNCWASILADPDTTP